MSRFTHIGIAGVTRLMTPLYGSAADHAEQSGRRRAYGMLHGNEEGATRPETSAGKERHFTQGYRSEIVKGAGHFIQRENPLAVIGALVSLAE